MIGDIEILENEETSRYFIFNKTTGIRASINLNGITSIEKIFEHKIKTLFFTDLEEINKYCKENKTMDKDDIPKATPIKKMFWNN